MRLRVAAGAPSFYNSPGAMADSTDLQSNLPRIVQAIGRVLREEGDHTVSSMIHEAAVDVEQSSFDNWNGGTYGYTIQLQVAARTFARLGKNVDKVQKDLESRIKPFLKLYENEHIDAVVVVPSLAEVVPTAPIADGPTFWRDGWLKLFLSHVSTYKAETAELAKELRAFRISGFVPHEDIEPTKEWEEEIRSALLTCDALVCFLTADFNASKWTDQEVGFAVGRGVLVIPVRLDSDPYGFMARFQGYSGRNKDAKMLARDLAQILAKHSQTRARMADALVTSFEESASFAEAKRRVEGLNLVQEWSPALVERVERATKENYEVKNAFGVPRHVVQLLAPHRSGA